MPVNEKLTGVQDEVQVGMCANWWLWSDSAVWSESLMDAPWVAKGTKQLFRQKKIGSGQTYGWADWFKSSLYDMPNCTFRWIPARIVLLADNN